MANGFTVNAHRFDPYKNFKFRVKWDGKPVLGVSKVSALKRTTEVVKHRSGGENSPDTSRPAAPTTRRSRSSAGITHDPEFERWANMVHPYAGDAAMDLVNYKKELTLEVMNEKGHVALRYFLHGCWVSEFTAVPDLDANANAVGDRDDQARARGLGARRRHRRAGRGVGGAGGRIERHAWPRRTAVRRAAGRPRRRVRCRRAGGGGHRRAGGVRAGAGRHPAGVRASARAADRRAARRARVGLPAVRPPRAELGLRLHGLRRGARAELALDALAGAQEAAERADPAAVEWGDKTYRPRRPTGEDLRRWRDRPPSDAEIVAALVGPPGEAPAELCLRDRGLARRGRPAGGCGGPSGVPGMRRGGRAAGRPRGRAARARAARPGRAARGHRRAWPARSTGASATSSRCRPRGDAATWRWSSDALLRPHPAARRRPRRTGTPAGLGSRGRGVPPGCHAARRISPGGPCRRRTRHRTSRRPRRLALPRPRRPPTNDRHAATPTPPRAVAQPAHADARPPARDLAPPAADAPRPLPHAAPPAADALRPLSHAAPPAPSRSSARPPLPLPRSPRRPRRRCRPTRRRLGHLWSSTRPLAWRRRKHMADAVSPPPPTPPTREAEVVMEAPVAEPSERAHRALAEVRRWMEEPPRRRDAGPTPAREVRGRDSRAVAVDRHDRGDRRSSARAATACPPWRRPRRHRGVQAATWFPATTCAVGDACRWPTPAVRSGP